MVLKGKQLHAWDLDSKMLGTWGFLYDQFFLTTMTKIYRIR